MGKWAFYTCFDDAGKVLNFIDLADDVQALINLIRLYGFKIKMYEAVAEADS